MSPLRTPEDVATWLEGLDDDDDAVPLRVTERRRELEGKGRFAVGEWAGGLKPFEMSAKDAAALLRERMASDRASAHFLVSLDSALPRNFARAYRQACRRRALACWREARSLASSSDPGDWWAAWFALADFVDFRTEARRP